jgi:hypothetical protein
MQNQEKFDYDLADQRLDNAPHAYLEPATLEQGMIFQLANGNIQGCNHSAEVILGLTAKQIHEWNFPNSSWRLIDENGIQVILA